MAQEKRYDLQYWVNNRLQETVLFNSSASICGSTKTRLKKGAYRLGKFKKKLINGKSKKK